MCNYFVTRHLLIDNIYILELSALLGAFEHFNYFYNFTLISYLWLRLRFDCEACQVYLLNKWVVINNIKLSSRFVW